MKLPSAKELKVLRSVIRRHYGLPRLPQKTVVLDEIANLIRKKKAGVLDDKSHSLFTLCDISAPSLVMSPEFQSRTLV